MGATEVEGGNAFADYLACPSHELTVVLSAEPCSEFPDSGLYLAIPIDAIGVTVVESIDVFDQLRIAYFDDAGNRFCSEGAGASGVVSFAALGTDAGEALESIQVDLDLPHCDPIPTLPNLLISATFDLEVGRDGDGACGP